MKVLMDGREFARAVSHVVKAMDRDHAMVLLTAGDGGLTVEGACVDAYSRAQVSGEVVEEGRVAVNGLWLSALAGVMPAGETSLSEKDGKLRLEGGGSRFTMGIGSVDNMPEFPELPETMTTVDGAAWARAIASVAHAAAGPGSVQRTPVMEGVHLAGDLLEATDRFSAARDRLPVDIGADAIIPAEWLKVNAADVQAVGMVVHDGMPRLFAVQAGPYLDATNVVAGEYPSLDRVWPGADAPDLSITVDRQTLLDAARRLKAVKFSDVSTSAPLVFLPEADEGALTLRLTDGESETGGLQRIEADTEGEAPVAVVMDARYLIDALGAFEGEKVLIRAWMHSSRARWLPFTLTTEGETGSQLIVPMRG